MKITRGTLAGICLLAATVSPAAAGGTLPCIPALDGRCQIWAVTHDGGTGNTAQRVIVTSPDGMAVYAAGDMQTADGFRAIVDAHDAASGERRWTATSGREGDGYAFANSLATSPDGDTLYMAGGTCAVLTDGSTCDVMVEAFDAATGARRWSLVADGGNGLDSAQSVAATNDVVVIGGQTYRQDTDEDYLVAAYDPATGDEIWTATYDGPAHGFDRGAEMVLAGDSAIITGRSANAADYDIATAAFAIKGEDAGELLWATRFNGGAGADEALAIDADAGGSTVVIAGTSTRSAPSVDPLVVAYDAVTGAERWAARYNDPGIAAGQLYDVAVTPDGRSAVAAGYTQRSDGKGPTTLAYDVTTGQRKWVANMLEGLGYAVAVSPNGERAYVTGSTYERRGTQHRTVSYQLSTGSERWRGLYEESAVPGGTTNTLLLPSAIAISPDGTHVYAGGANIPLGQTASDGLLLSYQA